MLQAALSEGMTHWVYKINNFSRCLVLPFIRRCLAFSFLVAVWFIILLRLMQSTALYAEPATYAEQHNILLWINKMK